MSVRRTEDLKFAKGRHGATPLLHLLFLSSPLLLSLSPLSRQPVSSSASPAVSPPLTPVPSSIIQRA